MLLIFFQQVFLGGNGLTKYNSGNNSELIFVFYIFSATKPKVILVVHIIDMLKVILTVQST